MAMASSTPWDKIELTVGIIAGIMAIIGAIAGFMFWVKKTIKDWIDEAVEKGVEKCQEALRKQKRDIDAVLLETIWKLPPAGPGQDQQRAETARKALLDFIKGP
jgi:alpha-D-ribose 1-methylphosphonate 5-triphosphate synthase subunit PhnL